MNWFTKLFTEDKTPATERSKKFFLDSLKECENYYKVYEIKEINMNWFTKLFTEDKTPATERSKKFFLDSLKECENYYKVYESIPKYKQYVEAFNEIREEKDFFKDMTEKNVQTLIRLVTTQPYWAMNYPGAEKLAFQYRLRKEREANATK